jgi:signal transduction histidine kinase
MLRMPAFPIAAILYVGFKPADSIAQHETDRPAPKIGVQIFAAIVLAVAVTILTTSGRDVLPPLFVDRTHMILSSLVGYKSATSVMFVIAIVLLLRRLSSALDLWLLVALVGLLLQTLLSMTTQGRYTAGFYLLFLFALFSLLTVMLALVWESTRLYGELALSASARSREREARLMSVDALASAISHEVGQPLSVVGLQGNAGLRWLSGEHPNVERAIKSVRASVEAGRVAFDVVKSVRATFAGRTGERTTFGLADLVSTIVPSLQRELDRAHISVQLALDDALPPVLADRVQLQRVLINLLSNAIESLCATEGRPRHIAIRSAPLGSHGMELVVSDNGVGIEREDLARIFDPFFTTKPTGTGLGLSLCRMIVEAHGGHLWASHGERHGATFHLELPASASPARASTSACASTQPG